MNEVFEMAPAPAKALWFLGAIVVLMLGIAALLGYVAWSSRHASFEVSPGGLHLRGDFWARRVPASALDVASARRVDLTGELDLRPRRRTLGTGLPGYASGWFRLANGEKALLYLTDHRRAVYVPTREGFSLLLSPADPDGLLAALQRLPAR